MHYIMTTVLAFACLLSLIGVSAVHVEIEPRDAIVFNNGNITILCRTGTPITYCRMTLPGFGAINLSPKSRFNRDYNYYGSGLNNGQCGVSLPMVTDKLNGQVMCGVGTDEDMMESTASMSLVVAKAPSVPELQVTLSTTHSSEYQEGEPIRATCIVKDGRPAANITWFMDDEVIREGLTHTVDQEDARTGLHTNIQNLTRNLSWRDNGRQLKCVAGHLAYGNKRNHTSKLILVNYPPRDVPMPIEQFGFVIGQTGEVIVEILANPQPQFTWIIGNTSIQEGDRDAAQKYEAAHAEFQGFDKWKAILFVDQVTEEDVGKEYYLKAKNQEGEKTYRVVISTSVQPAAKTPCRSDQFSCEDGLCLNINQRCNGVEECFQAQDEIGCRVSAVHVEIEPRDAIVFNNGNITILCRAGKPITYCRITLPGFGAINLSPKSRFNRDYNYYGSGLNNGQCGVSLPMVTDKLNGQVMCGVGTDDDAVEFTASMSLVVAKAPSVPELHVTISRTNSSEYQEGEQIRATCIVKDGRPAANITWYMDDEVIREGLTRPVDEEDARTGLHTIIQNLTRNLSWRDNGRQLKCVAGHLAYGNKRNHTSKLIFVRYAPRDVPMPIEQFGFVFGQTGEVVVEILANPQPQFTWIIGNTRIQEGDWDAAQKYEAGQAEFQGGGKWKAILFIDQVTEEDVGKEYYLKAKNQEGEKTYRVVISTSEQPAGVMLGKRSVLVDE